MRPSWENIQNVVSTKPRAEIKHHINIARKSLRDGQTVRQLCLTFEDGLAEVVQLENIADEGRLVLAEHRRAHHQLQQTQQGVHVVGLGWREGEKRR